MFLLKWNIVFLCLVFFGVNGKKISVPEEFANTIQQFLKNNTLASNVCYEILQRYTKEPWLLNMLDAAGKFPSGILSGNSGDLGAYDQCLSVENSTVLGTVYGKYCIGKLNFTENIHNTSIFQVYLEKFPETVRKYSPLTFGACLPNSCSATDFEELYKALGIVMVFSDDECQTRYSQPNLDGLDIGAIAFLAAVITLMIFSTIYDVACHLTKHKPVSSVLIAFSVFTNGKKLLTIKKNQNHMTCLDGLRVISMMLLILMHRYRIYSTEGLLCNQAEVTKWFNKWTNSYIIGAVIAVDTFLLISGLVASYTFMGKMTKRPNFNIFSYYLHRYLRLTPPFAAIVLVNASLLKYLGSGPQWTNLKQNEKHCRSHWWSALLYIQNYLTQSEQCLGQTWYLSVDMQLFLLSPLLLLSFFKWPRIRPFVLSALIICASLIPFCISWVEEFAAFKQLTPTKAEEYMKKLYLPTHTRATSWLVGLAIGYVMHHSKNLKNNAVCTLRRLLKYSVLWVIILTVLCACTFGKYGTENEEYNRLSQAVYTAFTPLAWAISLSCLIFICVKGCGGPINWILSNSLMQVLSKLTYSMYLLHDTMLLVLIFQSRTCMVFGSLEISSAFWGDFMFTVFLAVIWVLAFESPIVELEKILVRPTYSK